MERVEKKASATEVIERTDAPEQLRAYTRADFDEMYTTHFPELMRKVARFRLGDEAETVVQEVFLKALDHFEKNEGSTVHAGWLSLVLRTTALDRIRHEKHRSHLSESDLTPYEFESASVDDRAVYAYEGVDDMIELTDLGQLIDETFSKKKGHGAKKAPWKEIVLRRTLLEESYEEISKATGVPMGTVRSALFRALRDLAANSDIRELAGRPAIDEVNL